jgi:hypothetical protein
MKKFFNKERIIMIVVMACCIGGCIWLWRIDDANLKKVQQQYDALPTLTTTEEILSAIHQQGVKTYLIKDYQFPHYTTVRDLSNEHYLEGEYIYIHSQGYIHATERGSRIRKWEPYGESYIAHGLLYFDKETELEGFSDAIIDQTEKTEKDGLPGKTVYYYLTPDSKLTLVATLGNDRAVIARDENFKYLITGGTTRHLAFYHPKFHEDQEYWESDTSRNFDEGNTEEMHSEIIAFLIVIFLGALLIFIKS